MGKLLRSAWHLRVIDHKWYRSLYQFGVYIMNKFWGKNLNMKSLLGLCYVELLSLCRRSCVQLLPTNFWQIHHHHRHRLCPHHIDRAFAGPRPLCRGPRPQCRPPSNQCSLLRSVVYSLSLFPGWVVTPAEVLRPSCLYGSRGGPSPYDHCCTLTTRWWEEDHWSPKNYLAKDNQQLSSVPQLQGPHGLEEGKR